MFAKLPCALIFEGTLANLPSGALRLLWFLLRTAGWGTYARTSQRRAAAALGLSARRAQYAFEALQRASLCTRARRGYTLTLGSCEHGFVRWHMTNWMFDMVRTMSGAELKLYTVIAALAQGRGEIGIHTDALVRLTGIHRTQTFSAARALLKQRGLIDFTSRPRHPTLYRILNPSASDAAVAAPRVQAVPRPVPFRNGTAPANERNATQLTGNSATLLTGSATPVCNTADGEFPPFATILHTPFKMSELEALRKTLVRETSHVTRKKIGARAARGRAEPADDSTVPVKVLYETLFKGFRLLGMRPLAPSNPFAQRCLGALRARTAEGFTCDDALCVAAYGGQLLAHEPRQYVRKWRNLLYVWGTEFVVHLANATNAAPDLSAYDGAPIARPVSSAGPHNPLYQTRKGAAADRAMAQWKTNMDAALAGRRAPRP